MHSALSHYGYQQTGESSSRAILIEAEELQSRMDDPRLLLVDSREPEDYAQGHLPGALNLPPASMEWSTQLAKDTEVHHLLAPVRRITPLLSFLGISRDSRIVIYDDGAGYTAARIFWILDYFSHPYPAILNGGISSWNSAGGGLSGDEPRTKRGDFVPDPDPTKIADFRMVETLGQNGGAVLLDTLPRKNYLKEAIPGSVNIPYTETYCDPRLRRLRDPGQLKELFLRASVTPGRELILYCGIGYTASLLYFAARLLGYPRVRLYDGSLADWKARGGVLVPGRQRSSSSKETAGKEPLLPHIIF